MSDYTEHLISMAGGDGDEEDGARQIRCIHTRRRRKCIASGEHQDRPPDAEGQTTCQRCGL